MAYCLAVLASVMVLVMLARFAATHRPVAEVLERWEHVLFPLVLIGLGVVLPVGWGCEAGSYDAATYTADGADYQADHRIHG